jgi:DNA-binding beta-propeller fold protein YncE
MNRSIVLLCFAAVTLAGVFAGCGGSKEVAAMSGPVWPAPPDTPRVAYVRTFTGEADFVSNIGAIVGTLAGEQREISLARPFDVCMAGEGRFYVTDAAQGVFLFDTEENKVEVLGEKSTVPLASPRGIDYARGKVYIGLASTGQVAVLDDEGNLVRMIGRIGQFENPVDVVCDTMRNRILIVDNKVHGIVVVSEAGDSLFTIGRRGEGDGEFNFPQSLAIDPDGNIYVVDALNFRVEVFDSNGVYLRKIGSQGSAFGMFMRPKGIALDSYNNIYVLDALHQNYQIFNNAGQLLLFVGRYSPGNDGFENPVSIAIDHKNMIYVTDQLNARVQVFQLLKAD